MAANNMKDVKDVKKEIVKSITWTKPMVQELIDLVEEEKVIWDYTQSQYKQRHLRKDAFKRISQKMKSCHNIKAEEVMKKWQNLKSYFNIVSGAERKATASGAGYEDTQAAEGEAVWEHYKRMSFLKPTSGVTPMIENFSQSQETPKSGTSQTKVVNPASFCESMSQVDEETCSQWQARQCAKQRSTIHQKFVKNPPSYVESESMPFCESGSQTFSEESGSQWQASQYAEQEKVIENPVTQSRSQTDNENSSGHEKTVQSQKQMVLNNNDPEQQFPIEDFQEQVQKTISSEAVMANATSSSRKSQRSSQIIPHPQKKRKARNMDNACDDIGDVVIEFLKENKAQNSQNANSMPNLSANEKRGLVWGQDIDKIKNKNLRCSCIINVTKVIQEALMNDEDENT